MARKQMTEVERAREYQKTIKSRYRKEGAEDFLFWLWQKKHISQEEWEKLTDAFGDWKKVATK